MNYLKRLKFFLVSGMKAVSKLDLSVGARILVFFDMLYCRLRFHASFDEYFSLRFYNYKNRYRKDFLLSYHQVKLYKRVNDSSITRSKYYFYTRLSKFFQREVILVPNCGEEAFLSFVKKHKYVVLKPDKGSLGSGVFTLTYENDEQALQSFHQIHDEMVCEEYIHQHKVMAHLNPHSVNTIRIVTIRHDENDIEIAYATLRSGAKVDSFVDNLSSGGIMTDVDPETGIVNSFGTDHEQNRYAYHPITKTQLIGLNIPNWDKAVELVTNAHREIAENPIIGWDIAITEDGVDVVEANSSPGPCGMQYADCVPRGEKILKILNNKKNYKY